MENKLIIYIIWAGLIVATVVNTIMLIINVKNDRDKININDREW